MVIRVDASSEATLQAFANYQLQERGLAERTVYNATFVVRACPSRRGATGRSSARPTGSLFR